VEKPAAPRVIDRELIDQILRTAVEGEASDVHFKAGEPVLVRVKGSLRTLGRGRLAPKDTEAVFLALCPTQLEQEDLTTLQERDFSFSVPGAGRFRVNAFRQRGSLALVVRVLPIQIPDFDELNLPPPLRRLADERRGMVLVTGATGAGKSSTLAAMLDHINKSRSAHVITVEDPIELLFQNQRSSIIQREVGTDTRSFAVALRAALRQDPDVIMIGEMRDTETIDIALKAAETGHMVLSTAHTTDAPKTVQRLLAAFPPQEQPMIRVRLADCIRGIVSQRLLPRRDGSGLVPAVEVMVATGAIRDCIRNPERAYYMSDLMAKGRNYGMQTFDQDLLRLLRGGVISKDVAMSSATSPDDLELQLRLGMEEDEEMSIERHRYADVAEEGDGTLEADVHTLDDEAADAEKPETPPHS
jgi:twitching motility protein PilT